jgi:hypothetical protein
MASIRKRTWSTAKGERSAWIVAYLYKGTDGQRKQHIKTFATKSAATEWRAELQVRQKHGLHIPDSIRGAPEPSAIGRLNNPLSLEELLHWPRYEPPCGIYFLFLDKHLQYIGHP